MKTTLIIPTYNEAENLPRLLDDLFGLPMGDLFVLVVDDNSPDSTGQIAEDQKKTRRDRLEVIHRPGKLGLGSAYIQGFRFAIENDSDFIGQMDADFSHAPVKLIELRQALQNFDLALGSRYIPGGGVDQDWAFWRKGLSAFGNYYARIILNLPIRDLTGGFRLWRRATLQAIPIERVRSNGYVFQVEMAYLAYRLGFKIKEIPIYFSERRWGQSKMSLPIQLEAAYRVWLLKRLYRDLPVR